jgi:hypothetical protein
MSTANPLLGAPRIHGELLKLGIEVSQTTVAKYMVRRRKYERSRTHLALEKDAPESRAIQSPALGKVVELPQVGGLHHRYERRAA